MNKKHYETPEAEIEKFNLSSRIFIITESPESGWGGDDYGDDDF